MSLKEASSRPTTRQPAQVSSDVKGELLAISNCIAAFKSASAATEVVSVQPSAQGVSSSGVSPRARKLASGKGIDPEILVGTGPGGRVIERDIEAFEKFLTRSPLFTDIETNAVKSGNSIKTMVDSGKEHIQEYF